MGYMKILNLYKDQRIFAFAECYSLEKLHGTSTHIKFTLDDTGKSELSFFSGGAEPAKFAELFNADFLRTALTCLGQPEVIIYGEAIGGKMQGMKDTYGPDLKFVAFDVKMAGNWLDVPNAETLVRYLKLEFVDYNRGPATLEFLNAQRDLPSTQAKRNGITEPKKREGIVIRPIGEVYDDRGNRVIAKHKRAEFMETRTPRTVDPDKQKVLADARAIAAEWVTPMRLLHVLDRAQVLKNEAQDPTPMGIEDTGAIIGLMLEDVKREAKGEIVESKDAMKAIGSKTAQMFKRYMAQKIEEVVNDATKDLWRSHNETLKKT